VARLDAHDHVSAETRVPNDLTPILASLAPDHAELTGLVVEATDPWYWLVDGLCEAGYRVHLAHTAAIQPSAGLTLSHAQVDARWLAHRLRLPM
jgi:hypothetical protein